jgi:hypothetical protein
MYVDNTDILHWSPSSFVEDENLVFYVQQATTNWRHLLLASGVILKAPKCLIYFLLYKFVCGHAKLKSFQDLPQPLAWIVDCGRLLPSHITIPQPCRPDVPIVTHYVSAASKIHGVHFSPVGQSATHIDQMVQQGMDWIDCIHTNPLIQPDVSYAVIPRYLLGLSDNRPPFGNT